MQLGRRITALIVTAALLTGLWTAAAAGSGTAPFRDMDLIVHQEAVLLMAELGVLSGKEDGNFAPGEGIDRASMCRMIYGIMMGDLDPAAFSGVAAPLADIQGTWAEDYIKYCYSVGIVSSTGGNRFRPTGPVSVAAAAKMLLVCLGFDAAHRGYENSDLWSENIMRDAAALGLMDRVPQQPFEPITRENAAQMIYNVLFIQTRTPIYRLVTGGKRITDYRVRGTTLGLENFGLVKCVMTVGDATTNPSAPKISFVKTQPKAATIQGGGVILDALNPHGGFPIGPELAASNVALYAKADYKLDENGDIAQLTFRQLYSTRLFPAELPRLGSSADGTPIHTSAVAAGEQLRDLTHNVPGNTAFIAPLDDTPTYYLNGVCVDLTAANNAARVRGCLTALLDADGDGRADMVTVTVKTAAQLTGDPVTRMEEGKPQIQLPGVDALPQWNAAAQVQGAQDLKKGDVVLCALVGTTAYLERAASVQGNAAPSKQWDSTLTMDGIPYPISRLNTKGSVPGWDSVGGSYIFYLDDSEAVIWAVPAEH